ncbi:hypothetical protein A176_006629 [Myxococcus hansupus]|uniref:Uncharacterized protein n=1 Tax=Pseudomyxococcus hansupus TaxID=1297742 RepID=A0A0H4XMX7_9BACT|nr:MXAN_5187 C-terminal domain-containing protein [Myxococcus hansupus]AKQ69717.1 hypothetical protein A176_006629 [Myxococcus hansupus]
MPPPDARQSASKSFAGKSSPADPGSSEAVLQECEALEAEVAVLRNLYEQYFLGNERQAPTRAHDDLKKRMNKLKGAFIRSTSAKFRVAGLHNKFLTYERLWIRTLQEIEAGTYRRDVFKARRRAEGRKPTSATEGSQKGVVELPEDISDMDFEEVEEMIRPRPINEPKVAASYLQAPEGTPAKGTPAAAPLTPAVAAVGGTPQKTPAVAPLTPAVGGTPLRGTPAVAPLTGIPSVAPVAATPPRGLPTVTAPVAGTPARGTPTAPPGMAAKAPVSTPPMSSSAASQSTPPPVRPASASTPPAGRSVVGAAASAPPPSRPGGAATVSTAPPSRTASVPPPSGSGGMADDKLRAVYDAYVTAKRRCQEDTSKLSYESVAATLRKQVPELLKQHNAKAVEFKVVIKDGKASLKAVPK